MELCLHLEVSLIVLKRYAMNLPLILCTYIWPGLGVWWVCTSQHPLW